MIESSHKFASHRLVVVGSAIAALLTAVLIWLTFTVLKPTPPRVVFMATDPQESFSAQIAVRYREILAKDGIELKLVPTAGSVQSLARLQEPESDISIAILPAGLSNPQNPGDLVSLGTLFYTPLWVFSHGRTRESHEAFRGLRISIGPEGSGTRALSLEFLARVGIVDQKSATLLPLAPRDAAEKLIKGDIDELVILDAWESPVVRELLTAENVGLESVRRADAFVALYPYLNKLLLPTGVADMVENKPPRDVLLLAPMASLVVRRNLHPAIQYLLLDAAAQIHSEPGLWHPANRFPAAEAVDFPLSSEAVHYYKSGSPFLQRNLPFWLAVFVQQLLVVLIPVLGVVYPLIRLAPVVFTWVMRRRVYKLYDELRELEAEIGSETPDGQDREILLLRLDRLEERVTRFRIPMSFDPLIYQLRSHISLVREKLRRVPVLV